MKNLKKGLAVAMSLAMIATVMPTMNVNAAFGAITVDTPTKAYNFLAKLEAALSAAGLELGTIQIDDKITLEKADIVLSWDGTGKAYTLDASLKAAAEAALDEVTYNSDEYKTLAQFAGMDDALNAMVKVGSADATTPNSIKFNTPNTSIYAKMLAAVSVVNIPATGDMLSIDGYDNALKVMKLVTDNEVYEGNMSNTAIATERISADDYLTAKSDLEDAIAAFQSANYGETLDAYVTTLEKVYNKFVEIKGAAGIKKIDVDAIVKQIKAGTLADPYNTIETEALTAANYKVFADDSAVVELLDMFAELVDGTSSVTDALSKKNEAYLAYTKKQFSNQSVLQIVTTTKFADLIAELTEDQFAILKDYKEEVLDVVFTLDAKKVGNTYVEKSEKSPYVTKTQLEVVLNNMKTADDDAYTVKTNADSVDVDTKKYGLFNFNDKAENIRHYDAIAAHMADLAEALEAVTKDIEKITPANIKAADKAKLEAAEDAIFELLADGDFAGNLTSAQKRTVRQADAKITNLREAYDNLGIASTTGWYDKGNGNWGYNNEDGTPATKWVAAGKLWYYVKGGDMLRNSWVAQDATGNVWYYVNNAGEMVVNTTIDGYAINANGEWHK